MIKPIANYDAYFLTKDSKLYGIDIQGVKKIDVIDQDGDEVKLNDFFISGGNLFFSVTEIDTVEIDGNNVSEGITYFYKQSKGEITKVDKLPAKPVQSRSHYEHAEFTIKDTKYENKDYTDVKNLIVTSGIERFLMVDNFLHYDGQGIYFNVSDGRYNEVITVRDEGLYFWDVTKSAIEYMIGEGIMWK